MAIESICKGCSRKLRVADEHAGRKARCPHCKTIYEVPHVASEPSRSVFDTADELAVLNRGMWRLKNADGSVYGPVSRDELDQWAHEGRIAADAELQEEGSASWTSAITVYPALRTKAETSSNPFENSSNPFAGEPRTAPVSNPYSSPTAASHVGYNGLPHRGGLILTFGILSWVGCLVCVALNIGFGIAAWVMGRTDLAAMRAGRMDPSGESSTQAGMILGMINVILIGVIVAGYAVFFFFMLISQAF